MSTTATFSHKVYAYYTRDVYGNIPLNKILPLALDTAGEHAQLLNFGKDHLIEKGYTWVLSRINLELEKLVKDIETIYIDTWIHSTTSAFSMRFFDIHDGKGNRIASGTTYWSIIDVQTRRIVPIQKILENHNTDVTNLREVPAEMPRKILSERGNLVAQEIAQFTDLDYNGHVNSNRYLDWGINTFKENFLQENTLSRIELNYNNEIYLDDEIALYKSKNDSVDIELFNNTQQTIACKMRLHFSPKCQMEK